MSTTGSNDSWSGTVPTYGANDSNWRLATFQHRLGALALDCALYVVTLGIGWVIWSLVLWGQGQTPGKKILKIRVYAADTQRPATWGHMAIREFLIMFAIGIAAGVLHGRTLRIDPPCGRGAGTGVRNLRDRRLFCSTDPFSTAQTKKTPFPGAFFAQIKISRTKVPGI
jgi:uncharacterized RDD family membrane protein YckC